MKIQSVKVFPRKASAVFLLRDGDHFKNHALFRAFRKEDQRYLESLEKKLTLKGECRHVVLTPGGMRVLVLGLGEGKSFTHRKSILAMRRVIAVARQERLKEILVSFDDFTSAAKEDAEENAQNLAVQFEMANFDFVQYKTVPKEGWNFVNTVYVFTNRPSGLSQSLQRGKVIGEEINNARSLSNTPGADMTPAILAQKAIAAAKKAGIRTKVLTEKDMRKLKMGGVLGVGQGSSAPPKFIILEYLKGKKNEQPVVLVGKGVTFDSGGLNLKPSDYIYEMHMDMSGGAAVIHTMAAIARLKLKRNIVGLIPAVENMVSGSSYHPGDLLKTMSGKTIEVLNTDAEGRVILSDALTYAKRYNPALIVDIATLTGAAMVAVGQRASVIFTNTEKLEKTFRECGEQTGDFVWPLPLWEEYEADIKGTFGDVANVGKNRYGGAISGAVFLWQFIKGKPTEPVIPWVHIDIAPRMTTIDGEFLARGAAGASIYLLTYYFQSQK